MAIKNLNNIDERLNKMYANQTTTATPADYIDRSDVLLAQMQFIATYNKSFIKSK